MKKIFLSLGIIVLALALLNVFFSYRPYNVILVTIDTLRTDYLSCYNPKAIPTKHIDEIARNGVLFERDFSTIPITLPAHTSMLTSRPPHQFSVFNNGEIFDHKPDSFPMLPDILERKKDYHTAAFVSLGVLKSSFGLGSGFDVYEDNFDKLNGRYYKVASEVNALAIPWLEKQKDDKFFAWIHYSDPHEPYITVDAPPDTEVLINGQPSGQFCIAKKENNLVDFVARPGENKIEFRSILPPGGNIRHAQEDSQRFIDQKVFVTPSDGIDVTFDKDFLPIKLSTGNEALFFEGHATMRLMNKNSAPKPLQLRFSGGARQRIEMIRGYYSAEVQYVDKYIGELWQKLDEFGLKNNTILVVTADHGEGLKTHGNLGHVDRLYNETVHVPLIIYYPNLGRRGITVDPITNHLDIMPTILDLLHIHNKSHMEGYSLKHYVTWSPLDWILSGKVDREQTYSSTYSPEARVNSFAMFDGAYKLIHTPDRSTWKWEAYDMKDDFGERRNIARIDPKLFEDSKITLRRSKLENFRKDAEAAHSKQMNPTLDETEKEMLRGLGYVAGDDERSEDEPETQPEKDEQ